MSATEGHYCPNCGREMRGDPLEGFDMTAGQWDIYELVRDAGAKGIKSDVLFRRLYGRASAEHRASGMAMMHTRISQLNERLKLRGLAIRASRGGPGHLGRYKLISKSDDWK
jgi:hypothetical protein